MATEIDELRAEVARLRTVAEELSTENEELVRTLAAFDDWPDDQPLLLPGTVDESDKPTKVERWLDTGSKPYFAFSDRLFRLSWRGLAVVSGSMVAFPWGAHREIWTFIDAAVRTVGVLPTVAAVMVLPKIIQLVSAIRKTNDE